MQTRRVQQTGKQPPRTFKRRPQLFNADWKPAVGARGSKIAAHSIADGGRRRQTAACERRALATLSNATSGAREESWRFRSLERRLHSAAVAQRSSAFVCTRQFSSAGCLHSRCDAFMLNARRPPRLLTVRVEVAAIGARRSAGKSCGRRNVGERASGGFWRALAKNCYLLRAFANKRRHAKFETENDKKHFDETRAF